VADRPIDPGDSEVEELFERERRRGDPSEEMKREVRARLDASIAASPSMRGGDLAAGRSAGRGPPSPRAPWTGLRAPIAATGLGLVLAGGLALLWSGRHRSTAADAVPAPPSAPEVAAPPAEPPIPALVPEPSSEPQDSPARAIRRPVAHPERRAIAPHATAPAPSTRDADLELAIERDLLQRARTDFRAGRLSEALQPLEEHARRFPRGRLEEERAALRIQTLARLGASQRARDLAGEFAAKFPESPLLGSVRAAIGTAP
jgi:hypothetical protein